MQCYVIGPVGFASAPRAYVGSLSCCCRPHFPRKASGADSRRDWRPCHIVARAPQAARQRNSWYRRPRAWYHTLRQVTTCSCRSRQVTRDKPPASSGIMPYHTVCMGYPGNGPRYQGGGAHSAAARVCPALRLPARRGWRQKRVWAAARAGLQAHARTRTDCVFCARRPDSALAVRLCARLGPLIGQHAGAGGQALPGGALGEASLAWAVAMFRGWAGAPTWMGVLVRATGVRAEGLSWEGRRPAVRGWWPR